MARLTRVTNKIFGENASTTGTPENGAEIGQFGSAKLGTYNATADVAEIQGLSAWGKGWIDAVIPDQQYPALPEMTGVFKVLSYQTGYLMQEGVAEWDANTEYGINSIVKYAEAIYTKEVTSDIGDSTGITDASVDKDTFLTQISADGEYEFIYDGINWEYNSIAVDLATYGITITGTPAESDTITITVTTNVSYDSASLYRSLVDDNINIVPTSDTSSWQIYGDVDTSEFANKNLDNISEEAELKFQYAPFSVNNGTIDTDGNNNTLYTPTTPQTIDVQWQQPILSANGTVGVDNFAVWANDTAKNAYKVFDGSTSSYYETNGTSNLQWGFYSNTPIKVTRIDWTVWSTSSTYNRLKEGTFRASNDGTNWTTLISGTLETNGVTNVSNNTNYYKYYQFYNFKTTGYGWQPREAQIIATYQDTVYTGTSLICNPCSITTTDGRTKHFEDASSLDTSNLGSGTKKVLKNYNTGQLLLINDFDIGISGDGSFVNPVLLQNGTMGGNDFAVSASSESGTSYSAYHCFASGTWRTATSPTLPVTYTMYNGNALKVTSISLTFSSATYAPIGVDVLASNSNTSASYATIGSFTRETATDTWTLNLNNNEYYKYYKLSFNNLGTATSIRCSSIVLVATEDKFTLDNTYIPMVFKNPAMGDSANDWVYIGDVTLSSGTITAITNKKYNDSTCGINRAYLDQFTPHILETYVNGSSWYRVWSDKFCEQGGSLITFSSQNQQVSLLKSYPSANSYTALIQNTNDSQASTGAAYSITINGQFSSYFVAYLSSSTKHYFNWYACGYLS